MKARVKATGEIIEVYESCNEDFPWTDEMGDKVWKTEELIFLETADTNPDYWTRLEHQAAIAAMQGFLAGRMEDTYNRVAEFSIKQAHALVEKLKEKEERK